METKHTSFVILLATFMLIILMPVPAWAQSAIAQPCPCSTPPPELLAMASEVADATSGEEPADPPPPNIEFDAEGMSRETHSQNPAQGIPAGYELDEAEDNIPTPSRGPSVYRPMQELMGDLTPVEEGLDGHERPMAPMATTTPWSTHIGTGGTAYSGTYAMGYRFTPTTTGIITALGYFTGVAGTRTVKLWNDSGTMLASASVYSNGSSWGWTSITPVNVTAGTYYRVSVFISSSTWRNASLTHPWTSGNITISHGIYLGSDAFPNTLVSNWVYGFADIELTISTTPGTPASASATAAGWTSADLSWTAGTAGSPTVPNSMTINNTTSGDYYACVGQMLNLSASGGLGGDYWWSWGKTDLDNFHGGLCYPEHGGAEIGWGTPTTVSFASEGLHKICVVRWDNEQWNVGADRPGVGSPPLCRNVYVGPSSSPNLYGPPTGWNLTNSTWGGAAGDFDTFGEYNDNAYNLVLTGRTNPQCTTTPGSDHYGCRGTWGRGAPLEQPWNYGCCHPGWCGGGDGCPDGNPKFANYWQSQGSPNSGGNNLHTSGQGFCYFKPHNQLNSSHVGVTAEMSGKWICTPPSVNSYLVFTHSGEIGPDDYIQIQYQQQGSSTWNTITTLYTAHVPAEWTYREVTLPSGTRQNPFRLRFLLHQVAVNGETTRQSYGGWWVDDIGITSQTYTAGSVSGTSNVCDGQTTTIDITTAPTGGHTGETAEYKWINNSTGAVIRDWSTTSSVTVGAGTYACLSRKGQSWGKMSGTVTVQNYNSGIGEGTWVGNIDTDWDNCANWGNGKTPSSAMNVTIPSSATRWPTKTGALTVGTHCNNLTITSTSSATTQLTVTGALTISSDKSLSVSGTASGTNITVQGNWSNNGTFTPGNGTVTFSGGNATITPGGTGSGKVFNNVTVNTSGTKTLGGAIQVNGNFAISSGTWDVSTSNYAMTVQGNWTNNGTFTPRSGTVTFSGGNATINTGGTASTKRFNNLTVNTTGTKTLGAAIHINNTFTISGGTWDVSASNHAMTVAGNWANSGTFNGRSGTVTFAGTSTQTISGSSTTPFHNVHITNSSGVNLNSTTNARWGGEITFASDGFLDVPSTTGTPYWEDSTP